MKKLLYILLFVPLALFGQAPQVGDLGYGGILFYLDDDTEIAYVAALTDITEGAIYSTDGYYGYEWGCYQQEVIGADETGIGFGYQNTLDIINMGCSSQNGGIIAAQAALDFESEGYDDWYLPSKDELYSIYLNIGQGSSNQGNFIDYSYRSSTEDGISKAWDVDFNNGNQGINTLKYNLSVQIRPIRSFSYTSGCIDENALNFNNQAFTDDGTCVYSIQYQLNNGSSIQDILALGYPVDSLYGKLYEGGYIFYINDANEGGLVVNPESFNLTYYNWEYDASGQWATYDCNGCVGEAIGTGLSNNIQWLNSMFTNGNYGYAIGVADTHIYGGYTDWFIPSLNEAIELTNNLDFLFEPLSSLSGIWTSTEKKVKSLYNNGSYYTLNNTGRHYASRVNQNGVEFIQDNGTGALFSIRKFGSWVQGCMDDNYAEYNPNANFDDNSCNLLLTQQMINEGLSITEIVSSGVEPANLIGLNYAGGQIVHIHPEDGRTIILSPEYSQTQMPWYCSEYISNMSLSHNYFQAHLNQFEILRNCNSLYSPASYSNQLEINGYSDWVLPTHFDFSYIKANLFRSSLGDFDLSETDWPYELRYHTSSASEAQLKISQYELPSYFFGANSYHNVRTIRFEGNWINGCLDDEAVNYNPDALVSDTCNYTYVNGCIDELYLEFNSEATVDDGTCEILLSEALDSLNNQFQVLSAEATTSLSSLQQALVTWNTSIDLSAGWNMIGYGCPEPIDLVEGLSNHTESILIVKDNNGEAYLPEWNFNGIGNLIPGFGYQIKVTEAIEGFSLCDWYVNDIPEDNIVSLQDSLVLINSQIGCSDTLACNYDVNKLYDDGSCEYPELGYDCDGIILQYVVGDYAEGGIVFYVDSTGLHGLVSTLENINATYEWGCYQIEVEGADGTAIGTGYQNTLDIVSSECQVSSVSGIGIIAAQAALDYESMGYNDWFLPTIDELILLYNNLYSVYYYSQNTYWTSSSSCGNEAKSCFVNFSNGNIGGHNRDNLEHIIPIRSF